MSTHTRISISPRTPLNLDQTLRCGQAFRWRKSGQWWFGFIGGEPFGLRQTAKQLHVASTAALPRKLARHYLALDHDLPAILASIDRDKYIHCAIEAYRGLRLVRQPLWECTASFICSTMKNIPAIRMMLDRLCQRFGEAVEFEGRILHRFPSPEVIAAACEGEIRACGLGFRAPYLIAAARAFSDGFIREHELAAADSDTARAKLLNLPGVGPKVAECILVFSLGRLDRVPVDVWIARTFGRLYGARIRRAQGVDLRSKKSLTDRDHQHIGEWARSYFGEYAAYAQEYLFHAAQEGLLAPRG